MNLFKLFKIFDLVGLYRELQIKLLVSNHISEAKELSAKQVKFHLDPGNLFVMVTVDGKVTRNCFCDRKQLNSMKLCITSGKHKSKAGYAEELGTYDLTVMEVKEVREGMFFIVTFDMSNY